MKTLIITALLVLGMRAPIYRVPVIHPSAPRVPRLPRAPRLPK